MGNPPPYPRPRVITPACYYNLVEFVSNAKMRFITLKKEQNNYSKCSAFAFSELLPLFFISNSVAFQFKATQNS